MRLIPLCAWIYLLNYLDRGNIGNAKVLNQETGDSLLQQTNLGTTGYAVAVSLFSVAYTLFELPSNMIMKRYVRPSRWLGFLLFGWGVFTIGFSGVQVSRLTKLNVRIDVDVHRTMPRWWFLGSSSACSRPVSFLVSGKWRLMDSADCCSDCFPHHLLVSS